MSLILKESLVSLEQTVHFRLPDNLSCKTNWAAFFGLATGKLGAKCATSLEMELIIFLPSFRFSALGYKYLNTSHEKQNK